MLALKKKLLKNILWVSMLSGWMLTAAQAAAPLWSFEPLTETTVALPANSTALVQYRVTNQSFKLHTLVMRPIPGVTQISTGLDVCTNPFVLLGKQSCVLSLQIDGSQLTGPILDGPIVCQQGSPNQCYRPAATNLLKITVAPPDASINVTGSPLVLITNGAVGSLIITNTSTQVAATNIVSDFTGTALDGNVTETGNTCGNVAPGASCTLTYTSGNVIVPQTDFRIQGSNTNLITAAIAISEIGQPYGGGKIACAGGGLLNLIAANADNNPNIPWGGFGLATGAVSIIDGAANTSTIVTFLTGQGVLPPYPAQICEDYSIDSQGNSPCQPGNTCYADWFLPARDQLLCLANNRIAVGGFVPDEDYWSSSEFNSGAAWIVRFEMNISTGIVNKADPNPIRCVRSY